jgi:hypothetical protein
MNVVSNGELIDSVLELLEAATHSILYHRNVYARQHFRMSRKYHVPTPLCRSPLVCDYIAQALTQLRKAILSNVIDRFVVVIVERDSARVVERFVFDLSFSASVDQHQPTPSMALIEAHFRAFLLKLSVVDALLVPLRTPLPAEDAAEADDESAFTFNLVAQCSDGERANEDEAVALNWVPANAASIDGVPIIVPFKSAALGPFHLQLFCEENREAKNNNNNDDNSNNNNYN